MSEQKPVRLKEFSTDLYEQTSGDERALIDAMLGVVQEFGKFQSEGSSINAGYDNAENNPNLSIGVKCGNCVFHRETETGIECSAIEQEIEDGGACRFAAIPPGLVNVGMPQMREAAPGSLSVGDFVTWGSSGGRSQGKISRIVRNGKINVPNSSFTITGTEDDPAALITVWQESAKGWSASDVKVGHKFSTLRKIASLSEARLTEAATYKIPAGVSSAASRALKWISEGKAGNGFTSVGRNRASQLAEGGSISRDTVARMRSYFARHRVDRKATGFNAGEAGYPSPGRVAWDAWGGDAGQAWSTRLKLDK